MDLRDSTSMRNYELIKAIYDRCPNSPRSSTFSIDQYFDRCQDIIDLIERERPELKDGESEWPQREAEIDY
jgi:hypothetical protein